MPTISLSMLQQIRNMANIKWNIWTRFHRLTGVCEHKSIRSYITFMQSVSLGVMLPASAYVSNINNSFGM